MSRLHLTLLPFLGLVLLCLPVATSAQSPRQWVKYGDRSAREGDFYGAAYYYKRAFEQDSSDVELNWKYAEALRQYNDYEKAEPAYRHLVSIDEEDARPRALFWHATMLKHNRQYAEARDRFELYLKRYKTESVYHYKKAKQEVQSCQWALEHQGDSNEVGWMHLDVPLNSPDSEVSPYLAEDSTFYFAALRYDTMASKVLGSEERPAFAQLYTYREDSLLLLDSLYNQTQSSNANLIFHPDGSLVFWTRCNEHCAIYYREREADGSWGSAQRVKAAQVTGYSATHPFPVTVDDKTYLLFSSNRPRGKGGMDLWYCEILDGPKFGRARNLGRSVNTADDEVTPYYDTTEQALYYSSTWPYGYGGWDVFRAAGLPTRPGEPENAGQPINSSANDLYYKTFPDHNQGYVVSNRAGGLALKGETCCNDLYRFSLVPEVIDTPQPPPVDTPDVSPPPPVEVQLVELGLLPLTLYFENDQPDPRSSSRTTSKNYADLLTNYLGQRDTYRADNDSAAFAAFVENDLEAVQQSLPALADSLLAYLERGYQFQLGLRGFTSPLAATSYNERLAQRRIVSVQNYLLDYRNGALRPFVDSGHLRFHALPIGEVLSDPGISDNRQDLQASVFGLAASRARKVEITWLNQQVPDDSNAVLKPQTQVIDLGILNNGQTRTATLVLSNPGLETLAIDSLSLPCDCLEAELPEAIAPGQNGTLQVRFTAKSEGPFRKRIVLYSNAYQRETVVYVVGTVRP